MSLRRFRRPVALIPATLGVLALAAPAAHAGLLTPTATGCAQEVYEQPFVPWADRATYVLAPDGGFEAGASGWELNGAAVNAGNEPFSVHDTGDSAALALADGDSATSPVICVGIDYPTLRLFARNTGASGGALRVDVLFADALGLTHSLTVGRVTGHDDWAPTAVMPVVANLLALLPGARTPIAVRFTAEGGSWLVDDVYVDPYSKG